MLVQRHDRYAKKVLVSLTVDGYVGFTWICSGFMFTVILRFLAFVVGLTSWQSSVTVVSGYYVSCGFCIELPSAFHLNSMT